MAAIILKLAILFLVILAPLFKRKPGKAQTKPLKKSDTALSDYAVNEDGCLGITAADIKHK